MKNQGKILVRHYEACFEKFGDSARGVDWPSESCAKLRHSVMDGIMGPLDLSRPKNLVSVLDYGCGLGHFYEYLERGKRPIRFTGVDASSAFVNHCRSKFKGVEFFVGDILEAPLKLPRKFYDFVVLNGVMTEKRELTQKQMLKLFKSLVTRLFPLCKQGLAFNVMSAHVDWKRKDLFHLDFDIMADFLTREVSRHFQIRHDYGLYEYTVYVYRKPRAEK